jgi:hypothetical protein
MKRIVSLFTLFTLLSITHVRADEGMWIPLLIEKFNIKLMQEKGFKLSAEDIYSVNKACMKDAVVQFGGGCTGELISPEGLLITNHHCGYGQIQKHSSLENDYLTNGFWAMSHDEELPNPGLSVTFLKKMDDVTDKILEGTTETMPAQEKAKAIRANIDALVKDATDKSGYLVSVRQFFMGKQYFIFYYEVFRDVRLVGAPPSAIGKFGGETDNWVWPRHTGDFSLFRIYAGKNNKPAEYSKDNVPYKPLYYFPVSVKGLKEGDFTMVFGYPGSTSEYVPSYHIDMVKNYLNPKMIAIRTKKIEIMEQAMASDPLIRIQYSAKKAGLANSWKKWIGESQGLDKMNTIGKKEEYEKRLSEWIGSDPEHAKRYAAILPSYKELYARLKEYTLVNNFTNEIFSSSGVEAFSLARGLENVVGMIKNKANENDILEARMNLLENAKTFFKNYDINTDKKLFNVIMPMYGSNIDIKWQVPEYTALKNSCNGNFASISDKLYDKSFFTSETRFTKLVSGLKESDISKLENDVFYKLAIAVGKFLASNVRPELGRLNDQLQNLNRDYMSAQMEFEKDRVFYPDANSTLRLAYGNIKSYMSKDAVHFTCFTTLTGIIEKDNPDIYDYNVPEKLRQLYKARDYGRYAQDGELPVCFIANNHTTGGNSGSPVLNANGELIGVNFDRAWEGVASDLAFNPAQSRNISLDIRYALFLIDKFAGAGYLLKEMKIVE